MNTRLKILCAAALAACLAGCGQGDQRAGGLTGDEEHQLDNAAAMLDEGNNLVLPDDSLSANAEDVADDNGAVPNGNAQ